MALTKISGQIAHYPWGGVGAISTLLGWPASSEPEAEWWLGTHPLRPSTLAQSPETLSDWLADHGHPAELPFLFKILTPVSPLSLQVHPTTNQALEGYSREEEAGIALTSPRRNYKDRSAKPELVVALDRPFHALAGLRSKEETVELLRALDPSGKLPVLARWRELIETETLGDVIRWLLSGGDEVETLLTELSLVAGEDDTLTRLISHYPGDPGVAVAMMLNRVTLQQGEALFLDAGQLHAYLEGVAIEVMAPSDNVLRGGLTDKHVDVDELLAVASDIPSEPPLLPVILHQGVSSYEPAGQSFGVHTVSSSEQPRTIDVRTPAVWVVTEGSWRISRGDDTVELSRGEAAALSGTDGPVTFHGKGRLWWAAPR